MEYTQNKMAARDKNMAYDHRSSEKSYKNPLHKILAKKVEQTYTIFFWKL